MFLCCAVLLGLFFAFRESEELQVADPAKHMPAAFQEVKSKAWGDRHKPAIVLRTFAGDGLRMTRFMLPNVRMFLDPNKYKFIVVLDEENPFDHQYGECLEQENYAVGYEPEPWNTARLFGQGGDVKAKGAGFDRAQWSTFYLDLQTDSDVIGVVDADACLFSYVSDDTLFTDDGRLWLRGHSTGDYWAAGDRLALGSCPTRPSTQHCLYGLVGERGPDL